MSAMDSKIDGKSLSAEVIRDEDEYSGVRVSAKATLNTALLSFRIDVNVGDPIYPEPANVTVPDCSDGEPIICAAIRFTWCSPRNWSLRFKEEPSAPAGGISATSGRSPTPSRRRL